MMVLVCISLLTKEFCISENAMEEETQKHQPSKETCLHKKEDWSP